MLSMIKVAVGEAGAEIWARLQKHCNCDYDKSKAL